MNKVLILICFFSFSFAQACPLGEKEDHLTIARVMRNFGRFIMPAEMIVYRGQNKYEDITEAQLEEAIIKLSWVISCANAVIENLTGNLIPLIARDLPADKKAEYLDDLNYFMTEFKESLTDYQDNFIKIKAQAKADRNFEGLMKKTKEQNELIDRAHSKL